MQLLMEDIGVERKYVFISYQQKVTCFMFSFLCCVFMCLWVKLLFCLCVYGFQGLVSVFEKMFEQIEHRICLRHLYANFKKKFGGGAAIRDLLVEAVKATYFQA